MTPVAIDIELLGLPEHSECVTYAKDQPEYTPLPTVRTPDGQVVTQWEPTAEEMAELLNGKPITLVVHTFNQPLQPIRLVVGGIDLR